MSFLHGASAELRARVRRSWPIRTFRLGAEPSDDLSAVTTPQERLAMMWQLAREAWLVAGRTLPEYPRADIPVRIVELADPRQT